MRKSIYIIAGGLGTRSENPNIPKSLTVIAEGRTIIEDQLETINNNFSGDVYCILGYKGQSVINYLNATQPNRRWPNLVLHFILEKHLAGTLGACHLAAQLDKSDVCAIIFGDILFRVNLNKSLEEFIKTNCNWGVLFHPNNHHMDSDLIDIDLESGLIKNFLYKNQLRKEGEKYRNTVAAGIFFAKVKTFKGLPLVGDISRDFLNFLDYSKESVAAIATADYCLDTGTPERIANARLDQRSGVIERRSGRKKTIFIDLDDTLIQNYEVKNSLVNPCIHHAISHQIRVANNVGIPVVVITNQPGIAKGFFSFSDFNNFLAALETDLAKQRAFFDALYFCPHHPETGWEAERQELKIECDCRKPGNFLIRKASEDLNLIVEGSFFIGDSSADKELAKSENLVFLQVRMKQDWNSVAYLLEFALEKLC